MKTSELLLNSAVPRGITPSILLAYVRNTLPFLFSDGYPVDPSHCPHLQLLKDMNPEAELSHSAYYGLCLSAHHATVASFVPTDVDNQIRFKLWNPRLSTETLIEMADLTLESLRWDFTPVSARWVASPRTGEKISGHHGEWFSTAAAAYGALRKRAPDTAAELASAVLRELQREADVFGDLRKARDGIGALKASTIIAHNLGDLDRVIEMWSLPEEDPLREAVFKLGHEHEKRYQGLLHLAGKLNKAYICDENHRHFALRAARCLRKSPDFLISIGPFFDDWGKRIARHPQLPPEEVGSIVEALVDGWEYLNKPGATTGRAPVGYARALSGILEAFPGGFQELSSYIPARIARTLKSGPHRTQISVPRARFEDQWNSFGNSTPASSKGARP